MSNKHFVTLWKPVIHPEKTKAQVSCTSMEKIRFQMFQLYRFDHLAGEERADCFIFVVFWMSCRCYHSSVLLRCAMGWSVVCDCGISWSYLHAFGLQLTFQATNAFYNSEVRYFTFKVCWPAYEDAYDQWLFVRSLQYAGFLTKWLIYEFAYICVFVFDFVHHFNGTFHEVEPRWN